MPNECLYGQLCPCVQYPKRTLTLRSGHITPRRLPFGGRARIGNIFFSLISLQRKPDRFSIKCPNDRDHPQKARRRAEPGFKAVDATVIATGDEEVSRRADGHPRRSGAPPNGG